MITCPGRQERDCGTDPEFILILGTFRKKIREATGSFDVSVRPHRTNWLLMDGFS